MNILLVGAVEGTKVAFDAMVNAGLPPTHVLTLPKDKASRHSDFVDIATPAKKISTKIIYSSNINDQETIAKVESIQPDLCLILGWSQICHTPFRSIASIGNIGFHPAPLPKLRGRAVIPWTILLGLKETAATLFWLDEGTDSGDILDQRKIKITNTETAASLYERQTQTLAEMLPDAIKSALNGSAKRIIQDHSQASYCAKRTPDDGKIDWSQSAVKIERFIRAVGAPYPGAFSHTSMGRIWIDAAQFPETPTKFIGIPGQIQKINDKSFQVLCGDYKCIEVLAWRTEDGKKPPQHCILGKE